MDCSGHACDCTRPSSFPAVESVTVWSERTHVRELLGAGAAGLLLSGDDWGDQLATRLERLTPPERATVEVVLPGPPPRAVPAGDALARARSGWLPSLLDGSAEMYPHFQPIVDLGSGLVHGVEALIRGRIGDRLVSGGEIVGAATAHGQLFTLDQRARNLALEHGSRVLGPGEILFVNFNPSAIYDPDVCLRTTWATARRIGMDLAQVCFEVVEGERYPDLAFLARILDRYRAEGARVALDDLGAGYASLNYLGDLRPDVVKLDRALVDGVADDVARQRLVGALVDYAHALEIRVVAEGIESGADLATVRALGADYAQGYFLARPAAVPERVDPAVVLGPRAGAPVAH